jgi:two-component system, OmpR family, sensor kinase
MRAADAAAGPLRRLWLRLRQRSLLKRLVLAQLALLTLLWTLLFGLIVWESREGRGVLDYPPLFEVLLSSAEGLRDHPEAQLRSLRAMDKMLRDEVDDIDADSDAVAQMQVWQDGQLVYRSAGRAPLRQPPASDQVSRLRGEDGRQWIVRSQSSADGRTTVTVLVPDAWRVLITLHSRSLYLTPLIVSLPFLVLPAWWSVRLALRPWMRLQAQVAARGPQDLQPLVPEAPHRELRPLVDAINALLEWLRASQQRERQLIADAAHELRTPLTAMRISAEALGEHDAPPELMDNLLRGNERASRLVGQLLKLMRSDARRDEPLLAPVALHELLQERLADFVVPAGRVGVELELDSQAAPTLRGEREALTSLVDNLVENAIKYSPRGGVVRVALTQHGFEACLEVTDQGPGIDPQWRERVFDRFFRVPGQTQSGSGLGLAIVLSVARRHGGRIELGTGPEGRGLRVRVWLPARATGAVAEPARPAGAAGAEPGAEPRSG